MYTTSHLVAISLVTFHLLSVLGVAIVVARTNVYSRFQYLIQLLLALVLPVIGAVIVLVMAKEALSEPLPDKSNFDKDFIGNTSYPD